MPAVQAIVCQPSEMAKASAIGSAAAIAAPTYGMKRSTVASRPKSSAFGRPMKYSASARGIA